MAWPGIISEEVMSRRHLLIYIDDYLAGTLNPTDREIIERYLKANPDERRFVEEERRLKDLLKDIETPDPGDTYWAGLDRRIETATEPEIAVEPRWETPPRPVNIREVVKYLAPLAAALILFFGSVTFSEMPLHPGMQVASVNNSGVSESGRNKDYYAQYSLESGLMGSTVLGPPGSFGRKLLILGVISGSN